jgi:hypothetical protein
MEFLKDNDSNVCRAGANAVKNLSEPGDIFPPSVFASLRAMTAEFREIVRASIPQIVDLLKENNDDGVLEAGADTLAHLSEQGSTSIYPICRSMTEKHFSRVPTVHPVLHPPGREFTQG